MIRPLIIGLGCIAAVMLIFAPEIKGRISAPQQRQAREERRSFEQQARAAQDVTATEEDEREERRDTRRFASDEEISARKNYQPADHWRWKFEADESVVCEPLWDMPWEMSCHTIFERPIARQPRQPRQRWVEGPRIMGPDGRLHRTRHAACGGGGCPYGGYQ